MAGNKPAHAQDIILIVFSQSHLFYGAKKIKEEVQARRRGELVKPKGQFYNNIGSKLPV